MNQPSIWITPPVLTHGTDVWFSAYGFGWGYRAFSISYESVCTALGAADLTEEQIRLAFQLGKQTLLRAILQNDFQLYGGQRIWLPLEASIRPTAPGQHETPSTTDCDESSDPPAPARAISHAA
ncbi:hypothetical protein [Paraburkholderia sp. J8-2]|uniref:hypothetical protein n=1 Tax=Paraburkholderia sp. J8-2 TaxID=2805440 RepID=UPI002AB77157|nr:hypothetical protein [Paraburkholderia sp. J8-2]